MCDTGGWLTLLHAGCNEVGGENEGPMKCYKWAKKCRSSCSNMTMFFFHPFGASTGLPKSMKRKKVVGFGKGIDKLI